MPDDLHHLTLQDLRLLGLLLQERSVTRVAEACGQAQPAVSRKLQRLRELLADPLLVRSGARMVLTERAMGRTCSRGRAAPDRWPSVRARKGAVAAPVGGR